MADLLSGLGYTRLLDAVDYGLEAVKGDRKGRAGTFLAALHEMGFDVAELPGGPVKVTVPQEELPV